MLDDILQIKGEKIPVKVGDVNQFELNFYPENPRIFSIVHAEKSNPNQDEIKETLLKLDHVKSLVKSIKNHGGLIDPVIVHGGNYNVIEGNSRLAAYRYLASIDPIRWGEIRVKILPKDIKESFILALLGEYHIKGKKDWQPYEIAGYLYRQVENSNMEEEELANEMGMTKNEVKHLTSVYQFMIEHHTVPSRWSYYDEYIKSKKFRKIRKEYPEVDKTVVRQIKSGEIEKAVDLRDGIKKIAEAGGKTVKNFATGKVNFKTSVKRAVSGGRTDSSFKKLNTFRDWIHRTETKRELLGLDKDDPLRDKCHYELKKILPRIQTLLKKLDK